MANTRRMRDWGTALLATVISAAALTACSNGDASPERAVGADFEARLQSAVQTASSQYGELAEQAGKLNPRKPVPDGFKQHMVEVANSDRDAADELEGLTPPEEAKDLLGMLVAALRTRADAFEAVVARKTITLRQLERDPALAEAGMQLDNTLQQLTEAGLLSDFDSHD